MKKEYILLLSKNYINLVLKSSIKYWNSELSFYETTDLTFDARLQLINSDISISGTHTLIFKILSSSYNSICPDKVPEHCRVYSKDSLDILLNCNKGYIEGKFTWVKRGNHVGIKLVNI